jgi:hypothetical protein
MLDTLQTRVWRGGSERGDEVSTRNTPAPVS